MPGTSNSGRRKPVALRALEGNRSRSRLPGTPKLRPTIPVCPGWLSAEAKHCWNALAEQLGYHPGLLHETDWIALTLVSQSWADWRRLQRDIEKNGRTYQHEQHYIDENGTPAMKLYPKPRPEWKMFQDAAKALERLMGKLGLSPADLSRIDAEEPTSPKSMLDA